MMMVRFFKILFYRLSNIINGNNKVTKQNKVPKNNDPAWLKAAINEIGVKEYLGPKHNPRILEYHDYTSLDASDDETSWCASFVNWCLITLHYKGTNKANARSFLNWGLPMDKPERGCVAVFWRKSPKSWQGHVGFYIKEDDKYIYCLGGNQGDEVNISKYSKDRVLGYRWPVDG